MGKEMDVRGKKERKNEGKGGKKERKKEGGEERLNS